MESGRLFTHLRTLDNDPAFRNINKRPAENAFDDLLDSQDESGLPALREANRMRSRERLFITPDPLTYHSLAIQNVFQRATHFPTRYGDGSFPVWYGCLNPETTIWETAYHVIREEIGRKGHRRIIERHRIIYKVSCTAILIDLTGKNPFTPQLIDPLNHDFTQQIGKRIRNEMHPGLLAPSARKQGGINLIVFNPRILSHPQIDRQLVYRLDPEKIVVTVIDAANKKEVMSIDGAIWF